jgi:hypothetical protein
MIRSVNLLLFGISLGLPACWGESPTGESWGDLWTQCQETNGIWVTVPYCPSPCWPPAPNQTNCENLDDLVCATVCASQPACDCPPEAPFWEVGVGCVGEEACPE